MHRSSSFHAPRALPAPIAELCSHLESLGIETFSQGEALLADLIGQPQEAGETPRPRPAPVLLCATDARTLLDALPHAVVTGEQRSRLTQATAAGPVDVLATEAGADEGLHETLIRFGLGPLGFAYRPASGDWIDPRNQRAACLAGRLEPLGLDPNPFLAAPRRYWIAARLLAEYALTPSSELLEAAGKALPLVADQLPAGAPARRALSVVFGARAPQAGLAFLRQTGVTDRLFPGSRPESDARIVRLPARPALRWAAWLRGGSTSRGLVRLRMPQRLARQIERFQTAHPLDRTLARRGEAGARRLLQRFDADEISDLIQWRRIELAERPEDAEGQEAAERLERFEAHVEAVRDAASKSGRVRTLALDGRAVMDALGAGPGPHVGRALSHLAEVVAAEPEANMTERLAAELDRWARETLGPEDQIR